MRWLVWLSVFVCSVIAMVHANAQTYHQVDAFGIQTINGNTITVSYAGAVGATYHCGSGPYWIGDNSLTPGSFTFTFSAPISAIRAWVSAMEVDEVISFDVNGFPYWLMPSNYRYIPSTCNQYEASVSNGNLVLQKYGNAGAIGGGGEVNITVPGGITSVTIGANGCTMEVYSVCSFMKISLPGTAVRYAGEIR